MNSKIKEFSGDFSKGPASIFQKSLNPGSLCNFGATGLVLSKVKEKKRVQISHKPKVTEFSGK